MQELPEDVDPSCAGSFPALPREAGLGGPLAPPLARGSLSTLRRQAAGWSGPAATTQAVAPKHAAAQVQQFRRVGSRARGLGAAVLLALVAAGVGWLLGRC